MVKTIIKGSKDLLEDPVELSEQTLRNIKKSEADIKAGKVYTFKEIQKKYL